MEEADDDESSLGSPETQSLELQQLSLVSRMIEGGTLQMNEQM